MRPGAASDALCPSCRLVETFNMLDKEGVQVAQDKTLSHHHRRWIDINHCTALAARKPVNALCYNRLELKVIGHAICSQLG